MNRDDLKNYLATTLSAKHWEKVGVKDHHGIVIPLFSLRSKKSSGIGEFLDLIPMIDWCKSLGLDTIQLLPLNETGKDPSPYNAISSCALNPIHLSLLYLDGIEENLKLKEKLKEFQIFNTYQRVHYLQLKRMKMDWLYEYYLYIFDDLKTDKCFENFLEQNSWLEEYALFKAISEEEQKNWDMWPENLQNITPESLPSLIKKHQEQIHFYYAIQYLCFSQITKVKEYADKNSVLLEGDVPILVSKNSSDVWFNRSIFDMSHVAGAPPDSYSIYGQKWGFPLFNWGALKASDYHWWKRRLNVILNTYHMYRIDHVVGFFRIWAILPDEDALEGTFLPRDPALWQIQGNESLKMMLEASPLLPIAEDLGLIPKIVYETLKKLGICGTKVIPWEKNIFGYIKYINYESISVTTISTHDSDTFQQWWDGYPKGSTKFAKFKKWHYTKDLSYSQRKEILYDSHHTKSIFHINLLQEYLALYPNLVWDDPDDERINIPGTMMPTNWTYRFKPTLEEITSHKDLAKDIKEIIS